MQITRLDAGRWHSKECKNVQLRNVRDSQMLGNCRITADVVVFVLESGSFKWSQISQLPSV